MGILKFKTMENINFKKHWKVEYYRHNLTERVEKWFYTELGAFLYGLYIGKKIGFRTHVYYKGA